MENVQTAGATYASQSDGTACPTSRRWRGLPTPRKRRHSLTHVSENGEIDLRLSREDAAWPTRARPLLLRSACRHGLGGLLQALVSQARLLPLFGNRLKYGRFPKSRRETARTTLMSSSPNRCQHEYRTEFILRPIVAPHPDAIPTAHSPPFQNIYSIFSGGARVSDLTRVGSAFFRRLMQPSHHFKPSCIAAAAPSPLENP